MASRNNTLQHVFWAAIFFFAFQLHKPQCFTQCYVRFAVSAQWLERCALQARDCRFRSKRCAFALVALARQHFLILRKPNPLFPVDMMACLRGPDSFLQPPCVNESFFAKAVQLFTIPHGVSFEMRLQNGRRHSEKEGQTRSIGGSSGGEGAGKLPTVAVGVVLLSRDSQEDVTVGHTARRQLQGTNCILCQWVSQTHFSSWSSSTSSD